jgi:hypothetical protein
MPKTRKHVYERVDDDAESSGTRSLTQSWASSVRSREQRLASRPRRKGFRAFSSPRSFSCEWGDSNPHGEWVPGIPSGGQLAMLSPDGAVDISDFYATGEVTPTRFGELPPGSQQLAVYGDGSHCVEPLCSVVGIVPDGSIVILADNWAGHALAPQRFAIGPPCTVCSINEFMFDSARPWFAFDDLAVKVRITGWRRP